MNVSALHNQKVKAADLPLDRLATNTALSQQDKIEAASQAFEAVLLRQILQEAQKPVFASSLAGNSTADGIYRDMVVEQMANSISKSNALGLAQSLAAGLRTRSAKGTQNE